MCKNELGNSKNSNLPTIVYTIATIINRIQRLIFNNCRGTIKVAIVSIVSYRASLSCAGLAGTGFIFCGVLFARVLIGDGQQYDGPNCVDKCATFLLGY